MAVGEAMYGMKVMATGNTAFLAFSTIESVRGSTTVMLPIRLACVALGDAIAGSCWRCQLNFTAAASYGVPSVNLMFGRSLSVQVIASEEVSDSAVCGTIWPVETSLYRIKSYTGAARMPSLAPDTVSLAGSRVAMSPVLA